MPASADQEDPAMPMPELVVNRSSPVPLYFQVAEQIEQAIHDGQLAPRDRISNEGALAEQLRLSRPPPPTSPSPAPPRARPSRPWSTRGFSSGSEGSAPRSPTPRPAAPWR